MEYNILFQHYLEEAYKSFSQINTMVTTDNKRNLKEIYVPLTLRTDNNKKGIKIDGLPEEFSNKGNRILIVDRAGMGKSTLTKRIFLDVYEKKQLLPIYIELRRINESLPLTYQIATMMGISQKDIRQMIEEFQKGYTIFFFDGFDELQVDIRDKVRSKLQDFINQMKDNIFIMTSRPEDSFDDFFGFEKYLIKPLLQDESYRLLRNHDRQHKIADMLIEKLRENNNKAIEEYLTNPLLVSLLYAAFNYKKTIPLKKHLFYEQVYYAYFEKHDYTKEDGFTHQKRSDLDSYDFERILRILGFMCMKMQRVELIESQLNKMVDNAKKYCPDLNFNTKDFIDDLQHSVPLFCKDGLYLRWVHRSLQEFFTAKFIYIDSKSEQDNLLQTMTKSGKANLYYNIFDIYYDIDNYGFMKNIALPILEEYKSFYDNRYKKVNGIGEQYVEHRIGLLFLRQCAIGSIKEDERNNVFEVVKERCRDNGFSFMSIYNYLGTGNMSLYTAESHNMKIYIIMLLKQRRPDLFVNISDGQLLSNSDFLRGVEFRNISDITAFADSEAHYRYCNFCIQHGMNYAPSTLDIGKITAEIDRIRKMIKAKEDDVFFLQGV